MQSPLDSGYKITSGFNDVRHREDRTTYKHGATDWGTPEGTPIYSPEPGRVYYHFQDRKAPGNTHNLFWPGRSSWYQFSNYFNDEFGCLIFLQSFSGRTHVFAHINASTIAQFINKYELDIVIFSDNVSSFVGNLGSPLQMGQGELIGYTGNSPLPGPGVKSTGPHLHVEIHENWKWVPKERREDPEVVYGYKK